MSRTVHNFFLYALASLEPGQICCPFLNAVEHIGRQMPEQTSKEARAGAIAASVRLGDIF